MLFVICAWLLTLAFGLLPPGCECKATKCTYVVGELHLQSRFCLEICEDFFVFCEESVGNKAQLGSMKAAMTNLHAHHTQVSMTSP